MFKSPQPPRVLPWAAAIVVAAALLATLAASAPAGGALAKSRCHAFASPSGSDGASGSRQKPFESVGRLVRALGPGQRGCLLAGTYREKLTFTRGGQPLHPIVLSSAPGTRATICGRLEVDSGARFLKLTRLNIDGSCINENTIQVFADDVVISHDDITNRHQVGRSCVYLGDPGWGEPHRTLIANNRIHDCGNYGNQHAHGIYGPYPRSATIRDNYIYANAGFGVQLYPDAEGTLVTRNVIDGNMTESGLVFGGSGGSASSGNLVQRNIFTRNANFGVSSSWGQAVGSGNSAVANCFSGNQHGSFSPGHRGYTVSGNIDVGSVFLAGPEHAYKVRPRAACAAMAPQGHVGP